jgi:hypothetical protein
MRYFNVGLKHPPIYFEFNYDISGMLFVPDYFSLNLIPGPTVVDTWHSGHSGGVRHT